LQKETGSLAVPADEATGFAQLAKPIRESEA
jgi:hypothetical protein